MVRNRWLEAVLPPYSPKKRFFRRLDLTKQRSFNDTENMQQVSDPVFRNLDINPLTGSPRQYSHVHQVFFIQETLAVGNFEIEIRPILDDHEQLWKLKRITLIHDDNQARLIRIRMRDLQGPVELLMEITDHLGHDVPNDEEIQVFPVQYHAGNVHNHIHSLWPLNISHQHYITVENGEVFNVGTVINIRYLRERLR